MMLERHAGGLSSTPKSNHQAASYRYALVPGSKSPAYRPLHGGRMGLLLLEH